MHMANLPRFNAIRIFNDVAGTLSLNEMPVFRVYPFKSLTHEVEAIYTPASEAGLNPNR